MNSSPCNLHIVLCECTDRKSIVQLITAPRDKCNFKILRMRDFERGCEPFGVDGDVDWWGIWWDNFVFSQLPLFQRVFLVNYVSRISFNIVHCHGCSLFYYSNWMEACWLRCCVACLSCLLLSQDPNWDFDWILNVSII